MRLPPIGKATREHEIAFLDNPCSIRWERKRDGLVLTRSGGELIILRDLFGDKPSPDLIQAIQEQLPWHSMPVGFSTGLGGVLLWLGPDRLAYYAWGNDSRDYGDGADLPPQIEPPKP